MYHVMTQTIHQTPTMVFRERDVQCCMKQGAESTSADICSCSYCVCARENVANFRHRRLAADEYNDIESAISYMASTYSFGVVCVYPSRGCFLYRINDGGMKEPKLPVFKYVEYMNVLYVVRLKMLLIMNRNVCVCVCVCVRACRRGIISCLYNVHNVHMKQVPLACSVHAASVLAMFTYLRECVVSVVVCVNFLQTSYTILIFMYAKHNK